MIEHIETVDQNLTYIPTAWPTEPNTITSDFGPRNDPFSQAESFHTGIDVRGATGTPIYAAANGTVTLARRYGGYGKTIKIDHGGHFETLYAHLSSIDVDVGDSVEKGEEIGALGSTGRSTGPHLHYEVIENGEPVDPEYYMNFYNDEE
ncbi:Peptidase family M23 [Pelagirhabdus alkalitolerans]|uniref:Peptidase family M23 n=2 Tax=Pelagirhabdus alkalitolerans TaxID=1612202 RepID=A0A1G6GMF2_9BACI|nr:Peptidase family M23 [Pelagirhabdus alkalitolerans]